MIKRKKLPMTYLVKLLGINYHTIKNRLHLINVEIVKERGEYAYVMITDSQIEYIKIPFEDRKTNTREQLESMFDIANLAFSGKTFPAYGSSVPEIEGNKYINIL